MVPAADRTLPCLGVRGHRGVCYAGACGVPRTPSHPHPRTSAARSRGRCCWRTRAAPGRRARTRRGTRRAPGLPAPGSRQTRRGRWRGRRWRSGAPAEGCRAGGAAGRHDARQTTKWQDGLRPLAGRPMLSPAAISVPTTGHTYRALRHGRVHGAFAGLAAPPHPTHLEHLGAGREGRELGGARAALVEHVRLVVNVVGHQLCGRQGAVWREGREKGRRRAAGRARRAGRAKRLPRVHRDRPRPQTFQLCSSPPPPPSEPCKWGSSAR